MSESKHTPGPWHVNYCDAGEGREALSIGPYLDDTGDSFAFSDFFPEGGDPHAEVAANFALMCAAPDLLAACKAIVASQSEGVAEVIAAMEQARAAIAKVEAR